MIDYSYIGSEIKRIRKEMGLSQAKLAEKSNVSIDTIRRLENSYTLPRLDSLVPIFKVLGIEWELLLTTKKGSSWEEVEKILQKADQELDQNNLDNIESYIENLNYYRNTLPKQYKIKLDQHVLFFKACLARNLDKNLVLYKKYLEDALRSTNKEDVFKDEVLTYDELEIRILQSLSEYYIDIEESEEAFKILNNLKEKTPTESKQFPKICYNLARYYYMEQSYTTSVELAKEGLEEGARMGNYNQFPLLHYMLGISEFKNGDNDYKLYLETSLSLCGMLCKEDLEQILFLSINDILEN